MTRGPLPEGRNLPQASGRVGSASLLVGPAGLLLLFIVLPLIALVWRALSAPAFLTALGSRLVVDALRLTAVTTTWTLMLVVAGGTPLAFLLARRSFAGKRLVEIAVDFPLVLPPVVAGVALLMAFGRRGLLGQGLELFGIELPFTTAAVVMAQLFVAGPFYIRGARLGFAAVDPAVEEAAAIDGASPFAGFRYVTLPLALPGMASGAVLCLGRALSEFGATLLFAGNLAGRTQTMSLAINQALQSDLSAALALSVLLVVAATLVLVLSRAVFGGRLNV
ncbi:MAG: ABC transporter permease [Dehalococcoidia bacterium]